jgi:stearoyl-CoA desaturase (delta-9 desaturase)
VLSAFGIGEGWHNYHHVFPWDYKIAELGNYRLNLASSLINFFAYIGWAYDLKQPSKELVQRVAQKMGDGSHTEWGHVKEVPEEEENRLIEKQNIEKILLEAEERAGGI